MSVLLNPQKVDSKNTNINLEISNVLTTNTCAQIIIEIIKYLAYQKLQIPYDYERLKYVVKKKRENDTKQRQVDESWASQKYFILTSTAVDNLEAIFKNIIDEFDKKNVPDEMCIVFGTNIISAKEVYRISIPSSVNAHYYNNHNDGIQNTVRKVLRTLIFSKEMQTVISQPLSPMNMYVLLKRQLKNRIPFDESNFFMVMDRLCISPKTPQIVINLDYNPVHMDCCDQIRIYNDSSSTSISTFVDVNEKSDNVSLNDNGYATDDIQEWFQAEKCLNGFKANFFNGYSVSDLWIK